MAHFQVDCESLAQSASAVGASINAIRDAVNGMYANLQQLQSVWTGPASTAQQWRAAQQQMEQSLQAIQLAMQQASNVYLDAETQAAALFHN